MEAEDAGHSYSWLTLAELREAPPDKVSVIEAYVAPEDAEAYVQTSKVPRYWYGSKGNASNLQFLRFNISYSEYFSPLYKYIIPLLEKHSDGDDESVRIVFYFDS